MIGVRIILIIAIFSPFLAGAQSDTPLLERRITIVLRQERLDEALRKIGKAGGFSFSYTPSVFEGNQIVNETYNDKTIREILDNLFRGTVVYKVRSRHIILSRPGSSTRASGEQVFGGYVVDESTGERLANVSVYEPVTLSSTVSDSYGYFQIRISKPQPTINLVINKENYGDTTVSIRPDNRRLLSIPLKIKKSKLVVAADSAGQKLIRFWKTKILHPPIPNIVNIEEPLRRTVQVSVIPFVGTNHRLSGNVINDFSLNLIGGYAAGTRVMEVGGAFNIDRGDVDVFQAAGLFNAVGGEMTGGQIAGALNANYGTTRAAQVAGLFNLSWNGAGPFAVAGAMNVTRRTASGFFVAGAGNLTLGTQRGVHAAGAFNFATRAAGPVQIAAGLNFAGGNFHGLQFGAAVNFTGGNCTGAQISPAINFTAKTLRGSQVAGVLNYATRVYGGQLGLINICDSISGVPLGLFSFSLKGYHKLEISADEVFLTNVAFRSGVRKFYNIFLAGARPQTFENDSTYWTFGYGIGKAAPLARWLSINIDLTAQQIMKDRSFDELRMLGKLYFGFDIHLSRHLSVAFGATLNGYMTEGTPEGDLLFPEYQPKVIHELAVDGSSVRFWLGGKAGIRFF